MNQLSNPIRWTTDDLEVLPQSEGTRYELIDGELFVTRAPHWKHQQIIEKISRALGSWSESTNAGITIPSPGIVPSNSDSVIPDVVWVSNERLKEIEDEAGHFTGFPELVVEVLSAGETNIRRDKQAKLKLYSQGGVQEYWIIDRFNQQLEIYRPMNGQLTLKAILTVTDHITSPLLPNFSLSLERIFV
jgi:Uma2 family endonuclease